MRAAPRWTLGRASWLAPGLLRDQRPDRFCADHGAARARPTAGIPLRTRITMRLEPPEADEAAAEREERFVDLVPAVVADEQSLEVVQPGEGALDDPAVAAEPGAVLGLAAGDLGLDPALAEEPAVLVVVVAAVGGERVGPTAWPADHAAHGRHPSTSGISWVTSLRLPPVSVQASGIPLASTRR